MSKRDETSLTLITQNFILFQAIIFDERKANIYNELSLMWAHDWVNGRKECHVFESNWKFFMHASL